MTCAVSSREDKTMMTSNLAALPFASFLSPISNNEKEKLNIFTDPYQFIITMCRIMWYKKNYTVFTINLPVNSMAMVMTKVSGITIQLVCLLRLPTNQDSPSSFVGQCCCLCCLAPNFMDQTCLMVHSWLCWASASNTHQPKGMTGSCPELFKCSDNCVFSLESWNALSRVMSLYFPCHRFWCCTNILLHISYIQYIAKYALCLGVPNLFLGLWPSGPFIIQKTQKRCLLCSAIFFFLQCCVCSLLLLCFLILCLFCKIPLGQLSSTTTLS